MQLELRLPTPQPHASPDDVAAMIELLRGKGWMLARTIAEQCPDWNDRRIRVIASESGGQVVSCHLGYKLTLECTPEEIHHATERLRSQAREMTQRAIEISNVFHRAA